MDNQALAVEELEKRIRELATERLLLEKEALRISARIRETEKALLREREFGASLVYGVRPGAVVRRDSDDGTGVEYVVLEVDASEYPKRPMVVAVRREADGAVGFRHISLGTKWLLVN
jgi:hypothetical protein